MKKVFCKRLFLIGIFSLLVLSGCTGIPSSTDVNPEFRAQMEGKVLGEAKGAPSLWGQTEESISQKVFPNKSTKSDVKRMFGSTSNIRLTETAETWIYKSSVVTIFSGASYTQNTLIILFDENGVVKRYSMNSNVK